MLMRCCTVCLALLLLAGSAWAATYHVAVGGTGGCGGGPGDPMGTIASAVENCARSPGDIVYIHNGVYNEYLQLNWASGTNFTIGGGAITIASAPGEMATIRPIFTGTNNVLMLVWSNQNYIVFDRLTFDASTFDYINPGTPEESGGRVIELGADAPTQPGLVRFQNCVLIGSPSGNTFSVGSSNNEFVGNTVRNAGGYAFYISSGFNLMDRNDIFDNVGYAFHLYAGDPTPITGNVMSNNRLFRNASGGGGNPATDRAIVLYGTNSKVFNNLIYDNGPLIDAGIHVESGGVVSGNEIYHNTITNNIGTHPSVPFGGCITLAPSTRGVTARNNICWANSDDGIAGGAPGENTFDYNLQGIDPHFQNPTGPAEGQNLRLLAGSPAIGAGIFTPAYPTDLAGVTRPNPPSIGAYEAVEGQSPTLGTFYAAASGAAQTNCDVAKIASTPYLVTDAVSLYGLLACGLGGSTYVFAAETYVASLISSETFMASGSAGAPTTLMAAPGATVTFKSSTGGAVIWLNRGAADHHLLFDHIILDGDAAPSVNGLVITGPGAHHITIKDSEIKEMSYQGVALDGASDVEILRTNIHDGGGGDSAPLVQIAGSTNVHIAESTIAASLSGVPGIDVSAGSTGVLIERSTIRNNTGIGLLVTGSTVTLQNSLVYQNSKGVQWQTGTSASKAYYNTVWNNTGECFLFDTGVTTSEAQNNVCWANGSAIINNAGGGVVTTPNHTTDPSFVSTTPGAPGFLRLDDSPLSTARETATPIAGVTTDFNGTSRPLGPIPDQGAFEETPAAAPEPGLPVRVPPYGTTHFLGSY